MSLTDHRLRPSQRVLYRDPSLARPLPRVRDLRPPRQATATRGGYQSRAVSRAQRRETARLRNIGVGMLLTLLVCFAIGVLLGPLWPLAVVVWIVVLSVALGRYGEAAT